MRTRWITFDCFGTLVDWNSGFSAILTPFSSNQTSELMRAYHKFERAVEAERPYRPYREVLVSSLLRASREIGLALSETDARTLPQSWGRMPLYPDVEVMLTQLRGMGCRLAVLTNCDDDLFEQTHRSFRQPFDLVVTAQRVRNYKPSLSHFRFFSRSAGVVPSDWIHVACSRYHDIAPAKAFGIRRVWLDRDATGEDPTGASAHVHSASEVSDAVLKLYETATQPLNPGGQ